MDICEFKRPKVVKLCRGGLNKPIAIQTRELDESDFDTSQPVETFTTVFTRRAAVETITRMSGGNKKFSGVSIDPAATHIFMVVYDKSLDVIERDNYFILFDSQRYRVLATTDINEDNELLSIQTTNRGDSTVDATKA